MELGPCRLAIALGDWSATMRTHDFVVGRGSRLVGPVVIGPCGLAGEAAWPVVFSGPSSFHVV